MRRLRKRTVLLLLSALLVFSAAACAEKEPPLTESGGFVSLPDVYRPERLGLYTDEHGTMMYDGKPFRAVGVNYYSLFLSSLTRRFNVDLSLEAMELLKSYGVKVIRFNCGVYYYSEWNYYLKSEKFYFEALDKIVHKAEELGIGLIPSFFWTDSIYDYYDEPMKTCILDGESKSSLFRAEYVGKIVKRYANSPAIYMWEYGNEQGLTYNIPNWTASSLTERFPLPAGSSRASRTMEEDFVTYDDLHLLYTRFIETVKENDPQGRLIGNGDAGIREFAYHALKEMSWDRDNLEEHRYILGLFNPEGMDAVSMHRYSDYTGTGDKLELFNATGDGGPFTLAEGVQYTGWADYMDYLMRESSRIGKTCYIGEAGYSHAGSTSYDDMPSDEWIVSNYEYIMDTAFEKRFPLVLIWNYDPLTQPTNYTGRGSGVEFSWNESWTKGEAILEKIKEINEKFESGI